MHILIKSLGCRFSLFILVSGFVLFFAGNLGVVQASEASGIISSDITWTKTNSPYSLTGNVLVDNGVTLTVESGVTVNLNDFYIMINGTLRTQGTETERIQFNGGVITFTQYSNGWNEGTNSGCILENSNLNATSISSDVSLKVTHVHSNATVSVEKSALISYCSFTAEISVGDSSVISHNSISAGISVGESSIVTDNTITDDVYAGNLATITNNNIEGRISSCSASILNNIITGTIRVVTQTSSTSEIRNNTIRGGGAVWYFGILSFPRYAEYPRTVVEVSGGTAVISNNTIISYDLSSQIYGMAVSGSWFDGGYGISTQTDCLANIEGNVISGGFIRAIQPGGSATISENTLVNNEIGIGGFVGYYGESGYSGTSKTLTLTIERNLIGSSEKGISIETSESTLNIQNNTITNCSEAITLISCPSTTINFNNIQNCNQSITLADTLANIDATNNWWGTTDSDEISQKIFDYYDDFYLGSVNFTPFLTESNPQAPANQNMEIPEFTASGMLLLSLTATLVVAVYRSRMKKF